MSNKLSLSRQHVLEDSIKSLQRVNRQLAKLTLERDELTADIILALGHEHEGQKSYEFGVWKIECKTPMTFSLDKKAYESGDVYLPAEFDPVRKSISYSVDKKMCEAYMATASQSARDALCKLIEKKPSKPSVTIKENL